MESVPSVTVPEPQNVFNSDHLGPRRKQGESIVLVSYRKGSKSFIWVAKVLLLLKISCPTHEKENDFILVLHGMLILFNCIDQGSN